MSKNLELFRSENLPVFQNKMFVDANSAKACPKGDVVLVQNTDSGLIFNAAFDPKLLEYGTDYQNEQAHSAAFQRHLEEVKAIISRHLANKHLIEVGCGKGYFLEYLNQHGYHVTGVDPAYEGSNTKVVRKLFEPELGLQGDGIILRHVLEHIQNPVAFLMAIARANANKGLIYIEVPCFDWICENHAWYDIFYEHVNYFRLSDFERIFGSVLEIGRGFGGQYLYVVADLSTLRAPQCIATDLLNFPPDFLGELDDQVKLAKDTPSLVWGGASKGLIFSIYMQRAGVSIDGVIDINPAKQNRYLAGCGLKVMSPDEGLMNFKPDGTIFIMNSNYLDEIVELSGNKYKYIQVDQ